uniref:Uncharacterized protein n=1 Tax=Arundo donax TaxID=35708 RepID=A0A0A9EJH5_ARUDO
MDIYMWEINPYSCDGATCCGQRSYGKQGRNLCRPRNRTYG